MLIHSVTYAITLHLQQFSVEVCKVLIYYRPSLKTKFIFHLSAKQQMNNIIMQ